MARPDVNVRVTGDATGLARAVTQAQGSLKRLGTDLAGVQRLAAKALNFTGIGGTLSVAGLVAVAKRAADVADEFGKLAQRTGDTTESLSRLAYAASLNDATLEDLRAGMLRLSQQVVAGSEVIKGLGITLQEQDGRARNAGEVFRDLADRFAELPDGAEKTNLAVEIFGRAVGEKLIPTLNQGKAGLAALGEEADAFGKTISTELAARAEEFNDNLTRLQALSQGAAQEIGLSLIPALNSLLEEFLRGRKAGLSFSQALLDIGLSNPFLTVEEQIEKLDKAIARLQRNLAIPGSDARTITAALQRYEAQRRYWQLTLEAEQKSVENNDELVKLLRELNGETLRLAGLRKQQSTTQAKEELNGANALKTALKAAWQESINGARAAQQEAQNFFARAAAAQQEGQAKLAALARRGMSSEISSDEARRSSRALNRQADDLVQRSNVLRLDGKLAEAQAVAEQAERTAENAEALIEFIQDNQVAQNVQRLINETRSKALNAMGAIKAAEAKNFEEVASAQQNTLETLEGRINELRESLTEPLQIDVDIERAMTNIDRLAARIAELAQEQAFNFLNQGWQVETPNGWVDAKNYRGFASGGYTGPGGKYQPAGIVHRGEFVMPQHVVNQPGMLALLTRMLRGGRGALPGYSSGGLVSGLDARRAAMPALGGGSGGAPVLIDLGALGRFEMSAKSDVRDELVRAFNIVSLQRGRRR